MNAARVKGWLGRGPAGLLGMLVLVAVTEGFVSRHPLDALDPDDWQYHLARVSTARHARGRDLLCLGDSLMRVGVLPKVVAARSGLSTYNLAVCGSQAPASYHVLRRALDSGARPRAVLVDFNAALLRLPPQANRDHLPYLLGPAEALALGWEARDASFLGQLLAGRAVPSLRARKNLRAWVVEALAGFGRPGRAKMPPVLRHWAENDGGQVMPARPGHPWDVPAHLRENYPAGWAPHPVNLAYLRRFLALAEAHGLTVYWLIPPSIPAVQEAKERAGFDARYLALVRACQRRFPRLVVIDGRHAGYAPDLYFDPDHLGGPGAYSLSEDLGATLADLRRTTPADRWARLPRARPRPDAPRIATVFDGATAADVNLGPLRR